MAARGVVAARQRRLVETFVELADTMVEDFDVVEFLSLLTERVVELGLASEAGILLVDETGPSRSSRRPTSGRTCWSCFTSGAEPHQHRAGEGGRRGMSGSLDGDGLPEAPAVTLGTATCGSTTSLDASCVAS